MADLNEKHDPLAPWFFKDNPPRFAIRRTFKTTFLTSYRGMAFTGGGECELGEGQEITCFRWIDGRRPHGLFHPVDKESFEKRWVGKEESSHPQYLGCVIHLYEEQLNENCERVAAAQAEDSDQDYPHGDDQEKPG